MTLKEAHEIQRRELISLRAENARLKKQSSGLFPNEEKESLERHIRHLEQVIKTNDAHHKAACANWKLSEQMRFELEIENLDLKEQVAALLEEVNTLRERAEKAENEVRMLYFLYHPDVDYTNNISERGLRKFKRKQKQAVVLRSDSGGQHICDALTIIETARMQKKNIYDTVEAAFAK